MKEEIMFAEYIRLNNWKPSMRYNKWRLDEDAEHYQLKTTEELYYEFQKEFGIPKPEVTP